MMFEQWVYQPEVLNRLSGHYEDLLQSGGNGGNGGNGSAGGGGKEETAARRVHVRKLPEDVVARIVQARYHTAGYRIRRFCGMALFDMALHGTGEGKGTGKGTGTGTGKGKGKGQGTGKGKGQGKGKGKG